MGTNNLCVESAIINQFTLNAGWLQNLPVIENQRQILAMVDSNPAVLIKGKPGCGKSTQVPLMIFDAFAQRRMHCNIIVSQPSHIVAMYSCLSLCKANNLIVGDVIGYESDLVNVSSPQTRLTYCTTDVLLQKLVFAKHMNYYTHVILDEVHERTQEMDFLMLLVRKLQQTNSVYVKLIFMSEFIEKYAEYLGSTYYSPIGLIHITEDISHSPLSTEIYYIDDLDTNIGPFPESSRDDGINPDAYRWIIKIISEVECLEEDKIVRDSVLVILPGLYEILCFLEVLNSEKDKFLWWPCPLHSNSNNFELMYALAPPPQNMRKIIIVMSNVAESSIAIDDIQCVIDFCLTKSMQFDPETNFSSFRTSFASQSMCDHRASRVRRIDGCIFRLIRNNWEFNSLPEMLTPEMLSSPLEMTVLKAKKLDMGEPKAILALVMDPPDMSNLKKSMMKLKEMGAVLINTENDIYDEEDGELSFMGNVMASLPLDIYMTRLILIGYAFNLLEEAIIMACSMSVERIFIKPLEDDFEAYMSKLNWAQSLNSDPIACLNAYNKWREQKMSGEFIASEAEIDWADRSFIDLYVMGELDKLVGDVSHRLREFDIIETGMPKPPEWDQIKDMLLKTILAGSCYPNFYMRQVNDGEAVKLLGSRDSFNVVYLPNSPLGEPGPTHSSAIKEMLFLSGVPNLSFDCSSVEEMNELQVQCDISEQPNSTKKAIQPILPAMDENCIVIQLTSISSINHFYALQIKPQTMSILNAFHNILNKNGNLKKAEHVVVDEIYAAPYLKERNFYIHRCKVLAIKNYFVKVMYIDFGIVEELAASLLFLLPNESVYQSQFGPMTIDLRNEPPLAFACRLAHVQPVADPKIINKVFYRHCLIPVVGQVYSVVDDVVSIVVLVQEELRPLKRSSEYLNLNDLLVNRELAEFKQESSESKFNHYLRVDLEKDTCLRMQLEGTCSPPGMKIHTLLSKMGVHKYENNAIVMNKNIAIEMNSINSVIFNDDDCHERMLVAAQTRRSPNSDRLILGNTTMLPKLDSLPSLFCLLFTPYVEYRVDPRNPLIVGRALCGLGYDRLSNESYFPEHDFQIVLDSDFLNQNICLITSLRYEFNKICITAPNRQGPHFNLSRSHAYVFWLMHQLITRLSAESSVA